MRNLHFWFAAGIGFLLGGFAFAVLRVALQESLWLDELHTSWTISSSWNEIATRAAAGNQTPLYFWLQGMLNQTLGPRPDWILRLSSVFAWTLTIFLVLWFTLSKSQQTPQRWVFALWVVSWIVLDRLQWFYATEARPYALVQLFSLAGWCCIQALLLNKNLPNRSRALIVVWCLLSVTNIYLHLTAALPVALQWIVAFGLVWRSRRERSRFNGSPQPNQFSFGFVWTAAAITVVLALLPLLKLVSPVWSRRTQWASFAGDVTLWKAIWMFPLMPVLVSLLIGYSLDKMLRSRGDRTQITTEDRCLWWSAALCPWAMGWALAATGIAPMFHPRFVFASAMPLFVVGAIEILRFRHCVLRWLTGLTVACAIVSSQGSVTVWRAGYLVGSLRGEDWRSATKWISERIEPADRLFCSSGLVEANSSDAQPLLLPLKDDFAEYLSFPLSGVYRVVDSSGQVAPVTPLVGNHRQWATQVIEQLAHQSDQTLRSWLIYRGNLDRLKTKLTEFTADLRLKQISLDAREPIPFGALFVVEIVSKPIP